MAIEPLHSSKLLMCAQIVQCVGVCEKKEQERRRMKERGKEGGREEEKKCQGYFVLPGESKGEQINCWLYLVFLDIRQQVGSILLQQMCISL